MVTFWIETIIFIQKYWWLRSPDMERVLSIAWCVWPNGDLINNYEVYYYSYGRTISPNMDYSASAWIVGPSGLVGTYVSYVINYSYGI